MERSDQRDLQHIGLPTACAIVYSQVNGARMRGAGLTIQRRDMLGVIETLKAAGIRFSGRRAR